MGALIPAAWLRHTDRYTRAATPVTSAQVWKAWVRAARYWGMGRGVGALENEERDGPNPSPLCDDPLVPDGVRASSRQHPVQDRHADGSLGLLSSETAGS